MVIAGYFREKFQEPQREKYRDQGREQGRDQGRKEMAARWREWNQQRLDAQARGMVVRTSGTTTPSRRVNH